MSKKYTTNFLEDTNGSTGSANQVLISTPSGIDWVDGSGSSIIGGPYLPLAGGTLTGDLYLDDGNGATPSLYFKNGADNYWRYLMESGGDFSVKEGTSTRLTFQAGGNVGIGTTSPGYKLHVDDNTPYGGIFIEGDNAPGLTIRDNSSTSESKIYVQSTASSSGNLRISADNNNTATTPTIEFRIGGSEKMRISDAGNVGIGTTSPGTKLTVDAGSNIASFRSVGSGQNNKELLIQTGGDRVILDAKNADDGTATALAFESGSSERMRINSAGNVGIGTTSPTTKLNVSGNIAVSSGSYLSFIDSNLSYNKIGRNTSVGGIQITTGASATMNLLDNGNVGIGTTSPSYKLEVQGPIDSQGFLNDEGGNKNRLLFPKGGSYNGGNPITGAIKVTLPTSWTNTMLTITVRIYDYSTGESFDLTVAGYTYTGGPNWVNTSAWLSSQSNIDRNFTVRFGHDGTKCCFYIGELTSTWSYLKVNVIDATLNHGSTVADWATTAWSVGIESTAFSSITRTHTDTQTNNWARNGQDVYYGSGTGNVGIGTTSPDSKLEVLGVADLGSSGYQIRTSQSVGNNSAIVHRKDSGGSLEFRAASDDYNQLFIQSGGNIGIGTSSPTFQLHVNSIDASDNVAYIHHNNPSQSSGDVLKVRSDAGDNAGSALLNVENNTGSALYVRGDRNVGIGTTNPASKLHINSSGDAITFERSGQETYKIIHGTSGLYFTKPNSAALGFGITQNSDFDIFDSGSSVMFRAVSSSGNVGIGTTSPSHKLTINASNNTTALGIDFPSAHFDFSANSTSGYTSNFRIDDVGMDIGHDSTARSLNLQTGNQDRLTILGNGNVGIGTDSPGHLLEIRGTGDALSVGNDTNTLTYMRFANERTMIGYSGANAVVQGGLSKGIRFNVNNNTFNSGNAMAIDTSGNVGIGTTIPGHKLQVNGGIYATNYLSVSGVNTNFNLYNNGTTYLNGNTTVDSTFLVTNGNVGIGTTSPVAALNIGNNGNIRIDGNASGGGIYASSNGSNNTFSLTRQDGVNVGDLSISAYSGVGITGGRNSSPATSGYSFYVKSDGNVGIGTTSPGYKLDVNGSLHSTNITIADAIYHEGDTNTYMQFHTADQWRVVTAGSERLEVNNTQVTVANSLQVNSSIYASQYIYHTGDTNTYMRFPSNDTISWNTAGSERMRINSSGNIGIGTTAPTYKLHVAGTTYANGSTIGSSDLLLKDTASAYSTELKMQNNTHTLGIDYQNNETLRFITRSGTTTVPITFQMRAGTITAANFILSSDERKKTKIADLTCDNVDVSWKSFEMKDNEGEYRTGVIAQELEKKHPEFVNTDEEGFKTVKYIDLLIAKIAELEARLEKVENN